MTGAANSNEPAQFFDLRQDCDGWTVYDTATGEPARVNDVPQTGLEMEAADDLVDLLNLLARQKHERGQH